MGEATPGGDNTSCKGPEAGVSLLHLRNRKLVSTEGIKEQEEREVGEKAREVSSGQLM